MKKIRLKILFTPVALAFSASALFFAYFKKDMHICAVEYVYTCSHTQIGTGVDRELIERLGRLGGFTTKFDGTNAERVENMRLASEKIDGTLIGPGEIFSFNGTVGERTEERGFKKAKVIVDGRFVPGTGGGVCQVSTTLYNAALLSGLEICEYHPHSLQVYYADPSRDAMVSGNYFDLKFKNNGVAPVLLRVSISADEITCTVYGQSDGFEYDFESVVEEVVPRPPAAIIQGVEDRVVCYGREGVKSAGYLIRRRRGIEERILMRRDSYPAIADVIETKS